MAAQGSFPVPGLHSLLPLQIPLPLPPRYRRAQHRSRRAAVPSRCRSVGGAVRGGPDGGAERRRLRGEPGGSEPAANGRSRALRLSQWEPAALPLTG